jgi:iron complex outermembrane receptor protein
VVGALWGVLAAPGYAEPPATSETALFGDIPSVYGASKYEQRLEEAPSSVTLITAEEIRRYGYRTLADILRSVRGLYVSYDRNYSYVGVRGFSRPTDYSSRVLLMIDGIRTNENIFQMALLGTDAIVDVDLIDRIEVIRGPSSSLYGTSALFGVINIITKRGRDLQGVDAAAAVGNFNTRQARLSYGKRLADDTELLASMTTYASDGAAHLYFPEYDSPATNNGVADHLDGDRARNAFFKAARGDLSLTAAYIDRTKQVPTASYSSTFNAPGEETTDSQGFIAAGLDSWLDDDNRLTARVSYNRYRYDGTYTNAFGISLTPPVPPTGLLTRDYGYGTWWAAEAQLTTQAFARHKLIVGIDYQGNVQQDQGNYQVEPYYAYFIDERRSRRWALLAQDEWRLADRLLLNAGVRYDDYSEWGGTTNPRLALIYQVNPRDTLKLLYGQAFRAPSPYELYYTPSPWLQPETIRTTELVWEHALRRNLRFVSSLYQYSMSELINQQPDYTFRNSRDARAEGVEFELEGRLVRRLEGRISYAYQRAEDSATGQVLSNSPQHLAKVNLNTPLWTEKLIAGFELQYTGARDTLAGNIDPGYTVGNLTLLGRQWLPGLEVSASLYNLSNTQYADPGGVEHLQDTIPQDGRGWRFKLRYEF